MIDFAFQKNFKLARKLQNAVKLEGSSGIMGREVDLMDEDD
jgi:hypothetical protein